MVLKIFFYQKQNRQLIFSPKIPYDLVAERSEANLENLRIPFWWARKESNFLHSSYKDDVLPMNYGPARF